MRSEFIFDCCVLIAVISSDQIRNSSRFFPTFSIIFLSHRLVCLQHPLFFTLLIFNTNCHVQRFVNEKRTNKCARWIHFTTQLFTLLFCHFAYTIFLFAVIASNILYLAHERYCAHKMYNRTKKDRKKDFFYFF